MAALAPELSLLISRFQYKHTMQIEAFKWIIVRGDDY
jgi:hypothetical protein